MALLEVEHVTGRYGETTVLHGIDLAIEAGAFVALLGANGAGKTSTFRAITGAMTTTGTIRFDGKTLKANSPEAAARAGIAHVPEGRGTLSALTVRENLALGAYTKKDAKRTRVTRDRVLGYFPKLRERIDQAAGTLSGGEQQMLAIGRALMLEPRLMLLDEPSLGIAPLVVRDLFALLQKINAEEGVTILVSEQNARLALAAASRAYVLETGRIAVSGSADDLNRNEAIRRSYLGY
jgi:branched-chain amino acid transport system ATP-binding protein